MHSLTERQIREKTYYEKYAGLFDLNQDIDFSPVEGPLLGTERRPWNSYWLTYELPVNFIRTKTHPLKLLDFGCGPGENALRFTRAGFHVTGFDICEKNIGVCKKLFEKNKCANQGEFVVSVAEKLPFQSESFDVIVGIDILHHVDISQSMQEIKRVLRKDGLAIFREPVDVPFFEWIRNTKLVKTFFPNTPSLEAHITEDERKLNQIDFAMIKEHFPDMKIKRSLVFSRFDKLFRTGHDKSVSFLEVMDHWLIKIFPFFSKFGGASVIILKKS